MVDYKAIVEAIPANLTTAANVELAVKVPSVKSHYDADGNASPVQQRDKEGKQIYHDGKFMTDTKIIAAFDAIKGKTMTVGEGLEEAEVLVFPGLKPGHVQNAMQKRYRGEI